MKILIRLILILIVPIAIVGCEKEPKFRIGQEYGGGIVFYIDNTGKHGLIAAPFDQGQAEWGCQTTKIEGAEGEEIGTGLQNTLDILKGCSSENIAARICSELVLNGYDDWFLPSKDELNQLFIHKNKVGGFADDVTAPYWSSTEWEIYNAAWRQTFADYFEQTAYDKYNVYNVRAVRYF
ncbi:DUF1566 domain-containing protein [Rhodonellum sp.]|uniref:Lcl domain-containing protein n=1 Tax=Rhodonellum sp. TaxID=2231180 RepID=UPI0027191780|nr:DUF1566 domain-containing protein [Rhodonellum sp.]MDO9551060.1 DUF1566 domain-containing protein [Rhodonellum sp.]